LGASGEEFSEEISEEISEEKLYFWGAGAGDL